MTLVTYIPRLLPFIIFSNTKISLFAERFLKLIPFTALAALIFPGVLNATDNIESALVGSFIAFVFSYFGFNIIIIIVGSILGVMSIELLI
jgi:branched-subunit amino acid transport protein